MRNLFPSHGHFAQCLTRFVCGLLVLATTTAVAKEAEWIWSPAYEKELAPEGECYFRKTFVLGKPESGQVQIACDDTYELYVNGRQVGTGSNWKVLDAHDISKYLVEGQNTVAVKAKNSEGGSAGLVARVVVKQQGNTHVDHSTDATWKTALKEFPQWQKPRFEDKQWLAAQLRRAERHAPLGERSHFGRRQRPLSHHARVSRRVGRRSQGNRLADLHDVR